MSGNVNTFKINKKKMIKIKVKIKTISWYFSVYMMRKLWEKYKAIWTKTNIELNALPVYTKTKARANGDKVCTNFCDLNVPKKKISIYSLLLSKKVVPASIFRQLCL